MRGSDGLTLILDADTSRLTNCIEHHRHLEVSPRKSPIELCLCDGSPRSVAKMSQRSSVHRQVRIGLGAFQRHQVGCAAILRMGSIDSCVSLWIHRRCHAKHNCSSNRAEYRAECTESNCHLWRNLNYTSFDHASQCSRYVYVSCAKPQHALSGCFCQ